MGNLPKVRAHERMDYKRCQTKWYWKWRKGYAKKAIEFGALDLGTWIHEGFQLWYGKGRKRNGRLVDRFRGVASTYIAAAVRAKAPAHVIEKAEELLALGEAMCLAYEKHYGTDESVFVVGIEIPLEFTIADSHGQPFAVHLLKPDMIYRNANDGSFWLMENKTANSIRTGHLVIDDQARPYGVMAELILKKLGLLPRDAGIKGIMYNFLRKAIPDQRERNAEGLALNKNGEVS